MCRLVTHHKNGPFRLEPQERSCWLCQCGLSSNKPFCDGSHTGTKDEQSTAVYFYALPGSRRVDISREPLLHQSSLRNTADLSIASAHGMEVIRLSTDSEKWQQVQQIRGEDGGPTLDSFDHYSDCYLLVRAGQGQATMRVTQARDGRIDSEDHYPAFIQEKPLRRYIGSASRLIKSKDGDLNRKEISWFIQQVWSDQYRDGMRIDLINATLPMIKYYERLGYVPVGKHFIHQRSRAESQAMVYFADMAWNTRLSHLLAPIFKAQVRNMYFSIEEAVSLISPHLSTRDMMHIKSKLQQTRTASLPAAKERCSSSIFVQVNGQTQS